MTIPEQPLFPSRAARVALNPLLHAAFKSGCPCSRSLSAEQAAIVLRDADIVEIRAVTLDDVIASVDLALSRDKKWAPWHLGEIIQRKRAARYAKIQADKRKPKCHPVAKGIVDSLRTQEQRDQHTARKMIKAATAAEMRAVVKWAVGKTHRDTIGTFAAYLTKIQYDREQKA